jgi:cytochrome c oxidase assembly protein Cox11
MGVPHFSSVFFACLNQKYLSENIEQLLEVFFGIDEQLSRNKKIDKDKKNLKRITLYL